jgi:3-oxoacyl-[acyl-carrier protein] reductase
MADRAVPTYPDLRGKVAMVTGGSKGIGAECCRMLAQNGVRTGVVARSREGIEAIVSELGDAGADAVGVSADCTSASELANAHEKVESELGPIEILLPFAGGFGSFTAIEELGEAEWRQVIDDNLTSTHLTVSAVLPSMIARGDGVIVTMASNGGRYLDKLLTASYAAAKAGVVQYTRHIAMELGPKGIRANSIAPATVVSERVDSIMDAEAQAKVAAMSPLGRIGTPADCALAVLFLASDSSAWLTGVTLDIAGGRVML